MRAREKERKKEERDLEGWSRKPNIQPEEFKKERTKEKKLLKKNHRRRFPGTDV